MNEQERFSQGDSSTADPNRGAVAPANKWRQSVRHGGGFLVSGLIAFSVDATTLWLLTRWGGLNPFSARVVAIGAAMVAGWQSHRRLTFNVSVPPSLGEFGRYAGIAWSAAALNYLVYAAILIARPNVPPLGAMVAATIVSMGFSYLGMRFGVFRPRV